MYRVLLVFTLFVCSTFSMAQTIETHTDKGSFRNLNGGNLTETANDDAYFNTKWQNMVGTLNNSLKTGETPGRINLLNKTLEYKEGGSNKFTPLVNFIQINLEKTSFHKNNKEEWFIKLSDKGLWKHVKKELVEDNSYGSMGKSNKVQTTITYHFGEINSLQKLNQNKKGITEALGTHALDIIKKEKLNIKAENDLITLFNNIK